VSEGIATHNQQTGYARVLKVCGADAELGNFLLGLPSAAGTSGIASKLLLRQIEGVPQNSAPLAPAMHHDAVSAGRRRRGREERAGRRRMVDANGQPYDPQDWGRKFLPANGGCVYIDLNHLELCTPEVTSAFDFVAAWHAMLRTARQAQQQANGRLRDGLHIEVLVNNSDGLGNSYGSHLNFLLSRRAWNEIFHRKLHYMLFLASHQVSSIVITGQGKVGAENGAPAVRYQLSQRADFFETIVGLQTTYHRPLVNSRDEPLSGAPDGRLGAVSGNRGRSRSHLARLHVIFYDSNLCQVACVLKVGMMQIVLAMLEAGHVNPSLILDDPLEAVTLWSHDPTLQAKARTATGQSLTAVELQHTFLEEAQKFCDYGGCEGVVPCAKEILTLWADVLDKLRRYDLDSLLGKLDWVLKLRALEQVLAQRPELRWNSPQVKHMDLIYSSLDADSGLYWSYEAAGVAERVVEASRIDRLFHDPPEDTRAWTRARLLRLAGADRVQHIDWDSMSFTGTGGSGWPLYRTLRLPNPHGLGRRDTEHLFAPEATLDDVLDGLPANYAMGYVSHTTWTPPSSSTIPQGPALLPAPRYPAASGNDSVAVYHYDSHYPHDDPQEKGGAR
jgi:proteasome accessory factor A